MMLLEPMKAMKGLSFYLAQTQLIQIAPYLEILGLHGFEYMSLFSDMDSAEMLYKLVEMRTKAAEEKKESDGTHRFRSKFRNMFVKGKKEASP